MTVISYKTKQKPAVQKAVCHAIEWVGPKQTSYAELARIAHCSSSDCRYAILDLLDKGHIIRTKTKGYAGATRGNRYMYELTESGKEYMQIPEKQPPKIDPSLFEEA